MATAASLHADRAEGRTYVAADASNQPTASGVPLGRWDYHTSYANYLASSSDYYVETPGIGFHYYTFLHWSQNTSTVTWYTGRMSGTFMA